MIDIRTLKINNYMLLHGIPESVWGVDLDLHDEGNDLISIGKYDCEEVRRFTEKELKYIDLTIEILRDNLSFEVFDMGDFWQCELEDFVLVQPKFQITKGVQMPFIFGFKTIVAKAIAFKHVHHLQNVYQSLQQKELVWKQKS